MWYFQEEGLLMPGRQDVLGGAEKEQARSAVIYNPIFLISLAASWLFVVLFSWPFGLSDPEQSYLFTPSILGAKKSILLSVFAIG